MYIAPDELNEAVNDMKDDFIGIPVNKALLKQTKVFDNDSDDDKHDDLLSSYGY